MGNIEPGDPHFDGPGLSANANASASASANAKFLWGSYRALAGRLRGLLERGSWRLRSPIDHRPSESALRVEEYTEEDARVVRVELPGIDPEKDVEISASDGLLHIRVERREQQTEQSRGSFRSEFRYGSFTRDLPLPPGAGEQDVRAEYKDGILRVRVPVGESASPGHRIPISQG